MGTGEIRDIVLARSGRLFANPSFITGMAKILDIGATFDVYNENITPKEADYRAILSDWYAVGDELRYALEEYKSYLTK